VEEERWQRHTAPTLQLPNRLALRVLVAQTVDWREHELQTLSSPRSWPTPRCRAPPAKSAVTNRAASRWPWRLGVVAEDVQEDLCKRSAQ